LPKAAFPLPNSSPSVFCLQQIRSVLPLEKGGRVLFQFPLGNPAGPAHTFEPFVSQPTGRPAVSGVGNQKCFVAVGHNLSLIADDFNRFDAVQNTSARRPEFYLIDQAKKLYPLAVIAFNRFFTWGFISQYLNFSTRTKVDLIPETTRKHYGPLGVIGYSLLVIGFKGIRSILICHRQ